jgi:hypothetical protein
MVKNPNWRRYCKYDSYCFLKYARLLHDVKSGPIPILTHPMVAFRGNIFLVFQYHMNTGNYQRAKCSIPSMSSIFKTLDYQPHSVGYLSAFCQSYGRALPSTLLMASKTVVFYLSDEIFASHTPILVTIDAQSTAILTIERASDRSAETWSAHFAELDEHGFHSTGMASNRVCPTFYT